MDLGYPSSYHDVNSKFCRKFKIGMYFTLIDEYFDYFLGDPMYIREEQYVMQRILDIHVTMNMNKFLL